MNKEGPPFILYPSGPTYEKLLFLDRMHLIGRCAPSYKKGALYGNDVTDI